MLILPWNLEREIASVCRKIARKVVQNAEDKDFQIYLPEDNRVVVMSMRSQGSVNFFSSRNCESPITISV